MDPFHNLFLSVLGDGPELRLQKIFSIDFIECAAN